MTMPIITAHNLRKVYRTSVKAPGLAGAVKGLFRREYKNVEAVADVSFTIEPGELVGFLGPNGAGKTTNLKMLSGVLHPTSGEARVLGHVPWQREPVFQKQFALVLGQKNQLWWDLPALESFVLNREIYELPEAQFRATLDELVELFGVRDLLTTQVRKLSLGERMKCELIASLLHRPQLLLLDEPTIGLDLVSQKRVREFLRDYNRRTQITILLTSHYMDDVKALCDRVIIIDHGQLIFDGRLEALVSQYAENKLLTVTFADELPVEALERFGKVVEHNGFLVRLEVPRAETTSVASRLLAELPVADISIADVEVEEVVREIFAAGRTDGLTNS